jgi:hypothetical protein
MLSHGSASLVTVFVRAQGSGLETRFHKDRENALEASARYGHPLQARVLHCWPQDVFL